MAEKKKLYKEIKPPSIVSIDWYLTINLSDSARGFVINNNI